MSHIPEERLMELGLSDDIRPTGEESEHLSRCDQCAGRLDKERTLTRTLNELPQAEPPAGFVAAARQRFVDAAASAQKKKVHWMLGSGVALGLCTALAAVALVFWFVPAIPVALVVTLARILAFAGVAFSVLLRSPAFAVLMMVYGTVTVMLCTGIVGLYVRSARRAKARVSAK